MDVTLDQTPTATKLQASEKEEEILKFLEFEPRHINELVELTQLDMSTINSRLTIMEINGLVKNIGNMQYIRIL